VYSTNLRVLILEQELDRIREYVSRVPHRATGGLLLGNHFTRSGSDYLVITRCSVGVPDERLPDESCANHPVYTPADAVRGSQGPADARFLGRWHAHPDGLNRPSSADLEWAMAILKEAEVSLDEILHPIALSSPDEIKLYPYLMTRDSMTFHKVNWQVATAQEIDQVLRNEPAPQAEEKGFDSQIFSLQKTRDLLRDERDAVASLPGVIRCDVFEQGSAAILEVEVDFGAEKMVLQISAGALYPVHAPGLRVHVEGETRSFSSRVLREWNSSCHVQDIVQEAITRLRPAETDESVPLPEVEETEPRKREIALLKAAGYVVQITPADGGNVLLTIASPLLERAQRRFYAILPRGYPDEPPAVAMAENSAALADIDFETLDGLPDNFTLLGCLEKILPAARAERAQMIKNQGKGTPLAAVFLYFLLFLGSALGGYIWQTGLDRELRVTVDRFMATIRQRSSPASVPAPSDRAGTRRVPPTMMLKPEDRVVGVVVDSGVATNLTPEEAQWAISTALRPVNVSVVRVDLMNPPADLDRLKEDARGAAAVIVFSHGAGEKQSAFVDTIRGAGLPLGVVSMSPGEREAGLQNDVTFYKAVARPGGKSGAQRTLLDLKKERVIQVQAAQGL